jgi:hypothetical protein
MVRDTVKAETGTNVSDGRDRPAAGQDAASPSRITAGPLSIELVYLRAGADVFRKFQTV